MSASFDFDRIARAWLEDGPTELSDRVLNDALDEVHLTHQRRRWAAPWRDRLMSTPLRLAAAIVVLTVAVGGALFAFGSPAGPAATPSPTPPPSTPTPSPTASPTPEAATATPGSSPRTITSSAFEVPFTMTVPAHWTGRREGADFFFVFQPLTGETPIVAIDLVLPGNVYADPCDDAPGLREPALDASAEAVVEYLLTVEPLHGSPIDGIAVGGHPATGVDEAMTSTDRCTGGMLLWQTEDGPSLVYEVEHKRFYVFEVKGRTLVAAIVTQEGDWSPHVAEAEEVLRTISFR